LLTQRVNDLENQNNAYAEQVERQQEQMEELEREWTAKNLQLQNSIDTFNSARSRPRSRRIVAPSSSVKTINS